MARLAAWLGLASPSYQAVLDWVLTLRQQIGIPHTLKDLGVTLGAVDQLSEEAAIDPSAGGNPVPIGVPELKQMFLASLEGRI
jgi:alcohol dehydrogenase class IV